MAPVTGKVLRLGADLNTDESALRRGPLASLALVLFTSRPSGKDLRMVRA